MVHSVNALYSAAQIRQAEQVAIAEYAIAGLQLMRRAGQATFDELVARWPTTRRIAVCCGGGNNGGDGYVVARLALQAGMQVKLMAIGDAAALQNDALISHREFVALGGKVDDFDGEFETCDVIVDAVFGTGLNREVGEVYAGMIDAINAADRPVLAVDLPSGLHADSGCVMGAAVKADVTVTFIGLKSGLFTGAAAEHCGQIVCSTLDVPEAVFASLPPVAHLLSPRRLPRRSRIAHKGHFGHVLLIGGNYGFSGAIRLAGEAALRSGAGLVSIVTRAGCGGWLNIGRPELMCHGIETSAELQSLLHKSTVVVIGPGLGQDDWARTLLNTVLESDKPCVVDADALNLLAQFPHHRENWLLTPHPGEAARLLGCPSSEIASNRYAAVARLQRRFGGTCVLKGSGSLVADGDSLAVCPAGNPGMASGGMGDVLAGVSGALMAQGLPIGDAAKLAVYVHAAAADLAAAEHGERGLLAGDLLFPIRQLLNQ